MGKGKKKKEKSKQEKGEQEKKPVYTHTFTSQAFDPVFNMGDFWSRVERSGSFGNGSILELGPPSNECRALVPYGYCFDDDEEEEDVSLEYI